MKLIPDDIVQSEWNIPQLKRLLKIAGILVLIVTVAWMVASYTPVQRAEDIVEPPITDNASKSVSDLPSVKTNDPEPTTTTESAVTAAEKQKILDEMRKNAR
ncbi:MAG: hypothetical protein Q8P17_01775 [bacterium]|nr:hypothetical protein [bacterium]